jgi:hypothetical protein
MQPIVKEGCFVQKLLCSTYLWPVSLSMLMAFSAGLQQAMLDEWLSASAYECDSSAIDREDQE